MRKSPAETVTVAQLHMYIPIGVKFLDFYLKVGGPLPNIMLKLQYLITFTDTGVLLNKLPHTLIMRIHYSH